MIKSENDYEYSFDDGVMTVLLSGEIDHHKALKIRVDIDGRISELRPRKFILDLRGISFMDSSGLGLIMGRMARTERMGGVFVLRDPNPSVTKILTLAGLDRVIKIENSNEEQEEKKCEKKR